MAKQDIKEWQRIIGVNDDGDFGKQSLEASQKMLNAAQAPGSPTFDAESASPPTNISNNALELDPADASRPLHERALAFCLAEAERCGSDKVNKDRLREYFDGCTSGVKMTRNGSALVSMLNSGKRVSFCAAAQGFAEKSVAQEGEELPPWRSGVQFVEWDAANDKRRNQEYRRVSAIIDSAAWPHPGALAIYHNTQHAGSGHIERVIEANAEGFRSVGANENAGRWVIDEELVGYKTVSRGDGTQPLKLMGFVVSTAG